MVIFHSYVRLPEGKLHRHRLHKPQIAMNRLVSFQVRKQDWESRETRLGDKAAAAAKAAIIRKTKLGDQKAAAAKIVRRFPLHKEERTPMADAIALEKQKYM